MSRPIKDTPTLKGKDAKRFAKAIKENETKKISTTEYERMLANYRLLNGCR